MYEAFKSYYEKYDGEFLILCDHASNFIPKRINDGDLGISKSDMNRHIAYDIGAAGLSKKLGKHLKSPVVLSNFSRLVIDPNRGEDDPTLIMQLYDGSIIQGNRNLSTNDKKTRLDLCYRPYHSEIKRLIAAKYSKVLISIHSFTPKLKGGNMRPWHIGVLSASDRRVANPLLENLEGQKDIICGDNEPYSGSLIGDTMYQHALKNNRLHVLIEVRNDLINTIAGQSTWAARLVGALKEIKKEGYFERNKLNG
jgi:predicted N-formylglutamate amidohydrolase